VEERYTPGLVWIILTEGGNSVEEELDVRVGLSFLPTPQRTFLTLLSQGQTATYAARKVGLKGNLTTIKVKAVKALTDVINGTQVVKGETSAT
jgi:hypothetical protein